VYYEVCEYVISAISREKQIKAGSREKKNKLINGMNPEWKDLHEGIYERDCHVPIALGLAMTRMN